MLTKLSAGALLGLALLLHPSPASAQAPVVGDWEGTIEVPGGPTLPLVFHITAEGDTLSATIDSPAQGATGIPVSSVDWDPPQLTLEVAAIGGGYTGELDGDTLTGTWSQGGGSLPLTLERAADGAASLGPRPQEPTPPFPYLVEEVQVASAAGVMLAGTLTVPDGPGPTPGVVLVTGSGPQDRDESLMGHRPFMVLADHLTRQGIAVLRYDDRGVGGSTGAFGQATLEDFADDAEAALGYLDARDDVDAVGIIGHSEGGLVGPVVATRTETVKYLVLLGAPGVSLRELLPLQNDRVAAAMGAPPAAAAANRQLQETLFEILEVEPDPDAAGAQIETHLTEALSATGLPPDAVNAQVEAQVRQLTSPWMRHLLNYDPIPALEALEVPVLAATGSKDTQVPPDQNLPVIRRALQGGESDDIEVVELEGLNHLFQTADTGAPSEYALIEETMAPRLLETVSSWILERFPTQ